MTYYVGMSCFEIQYAFSTRFNNEELVTSNRNQMMVNMDFAIIKLIANMTNNVVVQTENCIT